MTQINADLIQHIGESLEKARKYRDEIETMKNAYRGLGVWICDEFGETRYSVHVLESTLMLLAKEFGVDVNAKWRSVTTARLSIHIPYKESTIEFYAIKDLPSRSTVEVDATLNEGVRA